ncbi:flagellar hook-associated protein FlgK [Noviherbaspirillum sp. Root189]|uniref:flagellar hook-associated protein FlgK n=1 Tax=Noviherbaspirillum sp. Root189 TaxID=1736487 RepID=UPI000708CF3D|nr:flagellar hook-associated protein FlgK [Noviherbaspirillum sp. Root189]KRB93333.1 flagellar biosynthesis protein FlgK [Noviherbaspirillum sp. Root189]
MASILSVGQSALAAAQAGLVTTGHNIANASTPGYSRQVVVQSSAGSQNTGAGYIGKGANVTDVKRIYNELLAGQVRSAQSAQMQSQTYYSQISMIDNVLADTAGGVSPALQDFFKGIQSLASNVNVPGARQSALSSAEALAARFQSLDGQLREQKQSLNGQISASVDTINAYATQIAKLNDAIEKAMGNNEGKAPNDLLDQRDHAISELSKEVKVDVVKQGNSYNVFIGNGQPLVVGAKPQQLAINPSATDQSRIGIGYQSVGGELVPLDEALFTGGKLGGLFAFRSSTLDVAQNSLGRVAVGLAMTFNAQHKLGQDQAGALGGDFFVAGAPRVDANIRNDQTLPVGAVDATITDPSKLTTSDYKVAYDGTDYTVTRLADNKEMYKAGTFPEGVEIDGVTLSEASPITTAGDEFIVRPTVDGAKNFAVAIKDISKIAAGVPLRTSASTENTGSGKISIGSLTSTTAAGMNMTIAYEAGPPGSFTGFDSTADVVVTSATGTETTYPAGTANIPYTDGDTFATGGFSFTITGTPSDGDEFSVSPNTGGVGDTRNAVLLGALQTTNTLGDKSATYQGAYAQLVSMVGNKTREMEVTSRAESAYLEQAVTTHEAESGVNLDEEATNLLRYQQAYQAAAKVMQTAGTLFDTLLSIGN